jgi:hypothetical protein
VRIFYRLRQFWNAVTLKTEPLDFELAQATLNPAQTALFAKLIPADRQHSINTYNHLMKQGDCQPDLLAAALLHDIGKLRYEMSPWERALVVLCRRVLPRRADRWGSIPPGGWDKLPGWHKAFIVTEQHDGWGAEMSLEAGASLLTASLIRYHHHPELQELGSSELGLLHKLWAADNEN